MRVHGRFVAAEVAAKLVVSASAAAQSNSQNNFSQLVCGESSHSNGPSAATAAGLPGEMSSVYPPSVGGGGAITTPSIGPAGLSHRNGKSNSNNSQGFLQQQGEGGALPHPPAGSVYIPVGALTHGLLKSEFLATGGGLGGGLKVTAAAAGAGATTTTSSHTGGGANKRTTHPNTTPVTGVGEGGGESNSTGNYYKRRRSSTLTGDADCDEWEVGILPGQGASVSRSGRRRSLSFAQV